MTRLANILISILEGILKIFYGRIMPHSFCSNCNKLNNINYPFILHRRMIAMRKILTVHKFILLPLLIK